MAERFHPTSDSVLLIAKHPNGDYVRYSDYAKLGAEVERLTRIKGVEAELAKLREGAEPDDGLLCPNCLCGRASKLGIECQATFRSGPFFEEPDARSGVRVMDEPALRQIITETMQAHVGEDDQPIGTGGCPRIHWYVLRNELTDAVLSALSPAAPDPTSRVKVPDGQTPLNDDLGHRLLDVFAEGKKARETGTRSPYHGHSLEHCLHAAGWVSADLRMALDAAKDSHPTERAVTEAGLKRAYLMGREQWCPAGILSDTARTERDWQEARAALAQEGK